MDTFFPQQYLMVWRPQGILDTNSLSHVLAFIEKNEQAKTTAFHRFIDLTFLEGFSLNYSDISTLALRRGTNYRGHTTVKSAFLTNNPLSYGMARMYQSALNVKNIKVRIFSDIYSAAQWLCFNPDILKEDRDVCLQ